MISPKQVSKSHHLRIRPRERNSLLVVGDLLIALVALFVALFLWANREIEYLDFSLAFLKERVDIWFYLLPLIWLVLMVELYEPRRAGNMRLTIQGVTTAASIGLGLYSLVYFTSTPKSLPRFGVAAFLISVYVLTLLWRTVYIRVFTTPAFMRRVLVVGAGQTGQALITLLKDIWPPPFFVVGLIDDDPQKIGTTIGDYPVLGGSDCLLKEIEEKSISDIIVAISGEMGGKMFQSLLDSQEKGVEITGMQTVYEDLLGRVPIFYLESDWILRSFVEQSRVSSLYLLLKRIVDILGGLAGVLLLLIISPLVSIATLLESGRPVFYTQTRAGRNDRLYKVLKFRTMHQDAEKNGQPQWAKENDERATRVGNFLRKTHLDELPQFLNVLRGEMSLVGPRPERPQLITLFQKHVPFYRARLLVKPGLTGWAQINYQYTSTVDETAIKLEFDLYYIKHRNLLLDILILLRTPATVLGFRGR